MKILGVRCIRSSCNAFIYIYTEFWYDFRNVVSNQFLCLMFSLPEQFSLLVHCVTIVAQTRVIFANIQTCSMRSSHQRYSMKTLFLKISQYWQENICVRKNVSFEACNFIKQRFQHRFFETYFEEHLPTATSAAFSENHVATMWNCFKSNSLMISVCFF